MYWRFSIISLLLLFCTIAFAQAPEPGAISNRQQFERAMDDFGDYLQEARGEVAIMEALFAVVRFKCFFPLEDFSPLVQPIKDHKLSGPTAESKFAAATAAKFIVMDISLSQARVFLTIVDKQQLFDQIGQLVY